MYLQGQQLNPTQPSNRVGHAQGPGELPPASGLQERLHRACNQLYNLNDYIEASLGKFHGGAPPEAPAAGKDVGSPSILQLMDGIEAQLNRLTNSAEVLAKILG